MKELLKEWIEGVVASDPKRYGSDDGHLALFCEYLRVQSDGRCDIQPHQLTQIVSVDRERRRALKAHPEWDHRSEKVKRQGGGRPDTLTFDLFKIQDPVVRKAFATLRANPHLLDESPARVRKSIRGATASDTPKIAAVMEVMKATGKRLKKETPKPRNHGAGGGSGETKR